MHISLLHWWGGWEYSHVRIWQKGEATQLIHYNVRKDCIKSRGIVDKEHSYTKSKAFQVTKSNMEGSGDGITGRSACFTARLMGVSLWSVEAPAFKAFCSHRCKSDGSEVTEAAGQQRGWQGEIDLFMSALFTLFTVSLSLIFEFIFKFCLKLERHCAYLSLFRSK